MWWTSGQILIHGLVSKMTAINISVNRWLVHASHVPIAHLCNMWHIKLTSLVYDLTFTSGGGGDGDGSDLCEEAAEPVIAVQDRVSTFLSMTSQDGQDKKKTDSCLFNSPFHVPWLIFIRKAFHEKITSCLTLPKKSFSSLCSWLPDMLSSDFIWFQCVFYLIIVYLTEHCTKHFPHRINWKIISICGPWT